MTSPFSYQQVKYSPKKSSMNLSMSYAILSSGANSSAEPEIAVIEEQTNNTLSGEND